MSKTKAGGKTSQHVSPKGRRLGIKATAGEKVKPGMILLRQRGAQIHAGNGTKMGRDFTIFAKTDGVVGFVKKLGKKVVTVL